MNTTFEEPYDRDDPKNSRWLDYLEDRAEQEREGC